MVAKKKKKKKNKNGQTVPCLERGRVPPAVDSCEQVVEGVHRHECYDDEDATEHHTQEPVVYACKNIKCRNKMLVFS